VHGRGPLTRAGYPNAQCAVAPGDSGGPVYSYSGSGAVIGRGTITAGTTAVTAMCPGVSPNGSNTVWYAPLLRPAGDPQIGSLQFYGVGILPGMDRPGRRRCLRSMREEASSCSLDWAFRQGYVLNIVR
jgi:hypothetical protein